MKMNTPKIRSIMEFREFLYLIYGSHTPGECYHAHAMLVGTQIISILIIIRLISYDTPSFRLLSMSELFDKIVL